MHLRPVGLAHRSERATTLVRHVRARSKGLTSSLGNQKRVHQAVQTTMPASSENLELSTEKLQMYLTRIGVRTEGDLPVPDADTLQLLQRQHVLTVPFENLSALVPAWRALDMSPSGEGPKLDIPHLFDKIVIRRRGGWCFELNTLVAALLQGLGYSVRMGCAYGIKDGLRVSPQTAPDHQYTMLWIPHQILFVSGGQLPAGQEYYVDVGVAANTPLSPIPIPTPVELKKLHQQTTWDPPKDRHTWQYRYRWGTWGSAAVPAPDCPTIDQGLYLQLWCNQTNGSGAWHDLLWLSLRTAHLREFIAANMYLANAPASPYVKAPFCCWTDAETQARYGLFGNKLVIRHVTSEQEARELDDHDKVVDVLRTSMCFELPENVRLCYGPYREGSNAT